MSNPLPKYPAFRWDDTARDLVFTWSGGHQDPVQIHSGRSVEGASFTLSRGFIAATESSMLDLSDVLELWRTQCAAWQLPADPGAEAAAAREQEAYADLQRTVTAAKDWNGAPTPPLLEAVYRSASDLVLVRDGIV